MSGCVVKAAPSVILYKLGGRSTSVIARAAVDGPAQHSIILILVTFGPIKSRPTSLLQRAERTRPRAKPNKQ